jgi:hypothetical protein
MEKNLLSLAGARGLSCTFANAYPSQYMERAWTRRPAGPPLAAKGAGLLKRTEEDLAAGEALSSEIVNTAWRTRLGLRHVPEVTPQDAGRILARISGGYSLTLFAHYSTDVAGHQEEMASAVAALERVDSFLEGLLPDLSEETLLAIASDHGNIEDVGGGHTRNPTFNLLVGPGADEVGSGLNLITDLAPTLLNLLSARDDTSPADPVAEPDRIPPGA